MEADSERKKVRSSSGMERCGVCWNCWRESRRRSISKREREVRMAGRDGLGLCCGFGDRSEGEDGVGVLTLRRDKAEVIAGSDGVREGLEGLVEGVLSPSISVSESSASV